MKRTSVWQYEEESSSQSQLQRTTERDAQDAASQQALPARPRMSALKSDLPSFLSFQPQINHQISNNFVKNHNATVKSGVDLVRSIPAIPREHIRSFGTVVDETPEPDDDPSRLEVMEIQMETTEHQVKETKVTSKQRREPSAGIGFSSKNSFRLPPFGKKDASHHQLDSVTLISRKPVCPETDEDFFSSEAPGKSQIIVSQSRSSQGLKRKASSSQKASSQVAKSKLSASLKLQLRPSQSSSGSSQSTQEKAVHISSVQNRFSQDEVVDFDFDDESESQPSKKEITPDFPELSIEPIEDAVASISPSPSANNLECVRDTPELQISNAPIIGKFGSALSRTRFVKSESCLSAFRSSLKLRTTFSISQKQQSLSDLTWKVLKIISLGNCLQMSCFESCELFWIILAKCSLHKISLPFIIKESDYKHLHELKRFQVDVSGNGVCVLHANSKMQSILKSLLSASNIHNCQEDQIVVISHHSSIRPLE
eukprot:TRINITY_DN9910_c0_g1_i3.p1 TRINITY_DN9910_c0_g1~~TRINITY_DN9910_c0_g1_i3.p1  ORF type:complete len:484 (+),score=115.00 TRINITY_DN9910_c0_g1_i3:479-1930(+)